MPAKRLPLAESAASPAMACVNHTACEMWMMGKPPAGSARAVTSGTISLSTKRLPTIQSPSVWSMLAHNATWAASQTRLPLTVVDDEL